MIKNSDLWVDAVLAYRFAHLDMSIEQVKQKLKDKTEEEMEEIIREYRGHSHIHK